MKRSIFTILLLTGLLVIPGYSLGQSSSAGDQFSNSSQNASTGYNNTMMNQNNSTQTAPVHTRRIEITPSYGWALNGSVDFANGEFKMQDATTVGAALSVEMMENSYLDLLFSHCDTYGDLKTFASGEKNRYDMSIENYQIGVTKQVLTEQVRPFGVFSLGASRWHAKTADVSDDWFFSLGLGAGLKYYFNDKIGIRLQGKMMLPMYFEGAGFFFGTGGASAGVTTSVVAVQGEFTGGIIFNLGK